MTDRDGGRRRSWSRVGRGYGHLDGESFYVEALPLPEGTSSFIEEWIYGWGSGDSGGRGDGGRD